jgi:polar amino acid transport system permease protein
MDSTDALLEQRDKERLESARARAVPIQFLFTAPWWLLVLIFLGIQIAVLILTDDTYGDIFRQLKDGVAMTLFVSFSAYGLSLVIGLFVGLARVNAPRPRPSYTGVGAVVGLVKVVVYNLATLYVEILRGLPILVVLLIVAFVIVPQVGAVLGIQVRGSSPPSAIVALALAYGAFLSETFRAGIQSIGRGQMEAARSLGMTYVQTMQYVVLPQAVRLILPPLGNDLIAMIKDSALVAILGIRDITQLAKLSSGQSFLYLQTYLIAAVIYLSMTVLGSLLVRLLERKVRFGS